MKETYILVIDIGNTHIVLGLYVNEELLQTWRFRSDPLATADEYYSRFISLKESLSQNIAQFTTCIIASVVPELTRIFTHLVQKYLHCPFQIVHAGLPLGLKFLVPDPSFIGADLLVNAYLAKEKYASHCIVIDFGTATTLQLVGKEGTFYGSIIAPGVMTSAATLFNKAALLSAVELEEPEQILGTNTKDALLAGIVTGHALMVDGLISRIRSDYAYLGDIKTIATGGISSLICRQTNAIEILDKTLTLEGLYLIGRELLLAP
jgi:type III pantothenate kinase